MAPTPGISPNANAVPGEHIDSVIGADWLRGRGSGLGFCEKQPVQTCLSPTRTRHCAQNGCRQFAQTAEAATSKCLVQFIGLHAVAPKRSCQSLTAEFTSTRKAIRCSVAEFCWRRSFVFGSVSDGFSGSRSSVRSSSIFDWS